MKVNYPTHLNKKARIFLGLTRLNIGVGICFLFVSQIIGVSPIVCLIIGVIGAYLHLLFDIYVCDNFIYFLKNRKNYGVWKICKMERLDE